MKHQRITKQQLALDMGQCTGSKLRKENIKAVYRHLGYLTDMQSTSSKCWTGIKIAGKNNNNLTYADYTTFTSENEEALKSLLMKAKKRVKKLA